MLTEKNFADALQAMNFTKCGDSFQKIFADNVIMEADLKTRKLFYPAQIKGMTIIFSKSKMRRDKIPVTITFDPN